MALVEDERDGYVRTITLNRPEKKNAVNAEMYARMNDLLEEAAGDDETRVVLLQGAGDNFTSGNDLSEFDGVSEEEEGPISAYQFLKTVAFFDKPLVTKVDGYAVGLGATVLLHADIVVASDEATIKFPFLDLGVVPEAGSSLLLPRMVGHQKAAEIIFTAAELSAEEGKDIGFVNDVVETTELDGRVQEVVSELAGKPPRALRETKRLMKEPYREELEETIDRETESFHERLLSEEAAEAISAVMEDREPDFS